MLERLESDQLVSRTVKDMPGRQRQRERVMYHATDAAEAAFEQWLARPARKEPVRTELLAKIAVARPRRCAETAGRARRVRAGLPGRCWRPPTAATPDEPPMGAEPSWLALLAELIKGRDRRAPARGARRGSTSPARASRSFAAQTARSRRRRYLRTRRRDALGGLALLLDRVRDLAGGDAHAHARARSPRRGSRPRRAPGGSRARAAGRHRAGSARGRRRSPTAARVASMPAPGWQRPRPLRRGSPGDLHLPCCAERARGHSPLSRRSRLLLWLR